MANKYQPKGSMCIACTHSKRDCSTLDFSKMPIMWRENSGMIVRCTDYQRASHKKPASDIDSAEHRRHTAGFVIAMADRAATYNPDRTHRIHRTPELMDWHFVDCGTADNGMARRAVGAAAILAAIIALWWLHNALGLA